MTDFKHTEKFHKEWLNESEKIYMLLPSLTIYFLYNSTV